MILYKQKAARGNEDFSTEFYKIFPHKSKHVRSLTNQRVLYEKFELCQLIRDIIAVNEATDWNLKSSIDSKYKSIGAYIRSLDADTEEYMNLKNTISSAYDSNGADVPFSVLNMFEVIRPGENLCFKEYLPNHKRLFHGSRVNNIAGILSRGLIMPKYVVNEFGGTRTDIGLLGAGIYFSDSLNTSLKYAHKSNTKNTRLIVVCDVALGNCKDYYEWDTSLTGPDTGFHSSHGVKRTHGIDSKFDDSEYVIYEPTQHRIRYLIELHCPSDGQIQPVQIEDNIGEPSPDSELDTEKGKCF